MGQQWHYFKFWIPPPPVENIICPEAQSHAYEGWVMKMSNFENPTWRPAAILKIDISSYFICESAEFDEIW